MFVGLFFSTTLCWVMSMEEQGCAPYRCKHQSSFHNRGPDSFNTELTFTLSQRDCVASPEWLILDWKPNRTIIFKNKSFHTLWTIVSQSQGSMGLTCRVSCTHTRCVRLACWMWLMLTRKDRRLLLLSPHRSTPVQDKVTHWSNRVVMSPDSVHIACLKLPVAALMWWLRNIFEPTVNCILTVLWKQSSYIWAIFVTFFFNIRQK